MLRIEKVQLQGFKSFCDLTEVVFNAEGITAVVGPNGCGKSNVADALNWVIGEQRAKALRGGKMEDVIFQGSRNRPASGLAEVVLTLRVAESFALRSVEATEPPPVNTAEAAAEAPSLPSATTEIKPRPRLALAHSYNEGEKITIARRLYRTGESEYEMNGRTCRLRDIQELFAGTGLGAAHYAIIEQGRIGQVLSAKPLDRRVLIEEAAGISKFKMRQRAAELKLDAARQNLSRVTDIISEVERQQNALKRQAAKARRFQRLRSEMRNLQKWVFISEYREAQQIIQQLEAQRAAISLQEATLLQEVQQAEEERQAALLQADQQQVSLTVLRAAAAETHLQREKERQQQEYLQAQIQALTQRALQAEQEEELLSERSRLLTQETERLRETLLGLETEINTQAAQLADAEQSHATQSAQEQATEKQLETAQQQVTGAATQQERWNQLVRQFTEASERAGKTLAGLSAEELRTRAQAEALAQERSSTLARLTEIETELQTLRTELSQAQSDLLTQQAAAREAEKNLQSYQREQVMLEQRLKSLLELDERRAYFSETVQAIMQAAAQKGDVGKFKIIGTLADFIKVSPEDEAMVEVGLREELQYLLTPSFEDALRAIDFLKRENHGRATFLIMQPSIPPGEAPPGTQTASLNGGSEKPSGPGALPEIIRLIDLLGLKPELRHLIQRALPRLSQTVVAEHIQQAIAASISTNGKGNSFLTASGEFISAGHIIAGGSLSQHGSGILALKREIEELHSQTAELAATLQQREETARRCQQEVAQGIELTQRLAQQQRDVEKELLQQRTHLSQHDREQERTVTHLRVIEAEIAQAQTEQADVESKLLHAQTELTQARLALTEAVSRATATSEIITQIRQVATTRMQELSSRRADFAAKSERRKGLQNDLRRSGNESEEILRRLARLQMEAHEALAQSQELRTALLLSQEQLQVWAAQQQTQEEEVATGEAALNEVRDRLQQGEMALTRARTTLQEAREQRANTDIERTKFHAHLEHLAANCHAEIGEPLTELLQRAEETATASTSSSLTTNQQTAELEALEALEAGEDAESETHTVIQFTRLPENFDLAQGKSQLAGLRTRIESLGPVNLLALQELGEQEERLGFLLTQKADIEQAVSDTLSVIAELKKRSQERFRDAFEQINRNFSEMFLELFGGGHGEMRLIDETDILESGIDIIAQPPGKRLQNVLLLSGGEKAMAALALVMGIFKYRPSPFCLLDEVDAPLDDVNIGRFADKILEMSQRTQFMVITHSKRTMEAAKTLYGVTMEDPGVSKLISVRLT